MKSNYRLAFERAAKQDADKLRKLGYTVTYVSEEEHEDGVGAGIGWNCVIQHPGDKYPVWNLVSREVKDLGIKTEVGDWVDLIELGEHTFCKCLCGAEAVYQRLSNSGAQYVCEAHK